MLTVATDKHLCSSQNSVHLNFHCDVLIAASMYTQKSKTVQSNALLCQKGTGLINRGHNMLHQLSLDTNRLGVDK